MFVQVPAPAGERWNWALATPEPPSAELEETATALPRTLLLLAGAVTAPVGAVESLLRVSTVAALVLPALSVEVTDSVGLFVSPAGQAKLLVVTRSEEGRVGKECRSRGSPAHLKKKGGGMVGGGGGAGGAGAVLGVVGAGGGGRA